MDVRLRLRWEVLRLSSAASALNTSKFVPALAERYAQADVAALVFAPRLCSVSGATKWLSANKALIMLSARGKSDDKLWFTFFHEAGHIVKHGKKEVFLETKDHHDCDSEKEQEADRFAIEHTLTEAEEQEIIESLPLTPDDILHFSGKFNTHPAIIVGRLAHKELLHESIGHNHGFFVRIDLDTMN